MSKISAFVIFAVILSLSGVLAVNRQVYGSSVGVPLQMESNSIPSMVSGGLSSLHGGLPSGNLAHSNNGFTLFELGTKCGGLTNYEVSGPIMRTTVQYPLGILFGGAQITRSIPMVASTTFQTAAIRFRIHLFGTWSGQPCSLSSNGDTIFQQSFSGSNLFKDVEIQVPYTSSVLNLLFTCTTQDVNSLTWTISDTGYHFSKCPMEYLGDQNDEGCHYVGNSLFTGMASQQNSPLVQEKEDTPAWANGLTTGTTDANSQIVILHKRPELQPASETSISQLVQPSLYLIGNNFDTTSFSTGNIKVGTISFNGQSVMGPITGTTQVSRTFTTLPSTQSAVLRVRLYVLGSWTSVPFTFQVSGSPVYTTTLTGRNTYQDVEISFPASSQKPLELSFGVTGDSEAQPWAVSDLAFTVSNAPVGKIYSSSTNGFVSVPNSFYTALLNGIYNQQFPEVQAQPAWINKVNSGQFNNAFDTIAVNGVAIPLGGDNQNNLNYVNILGGSNSYAPGVTAPSVADLINIKMYLVGSQPDTTPFTGIGSANIQYLNGAPALGPFSGSNVVSMNLNPLQSTQSGILRLRLHTTGVWASVPFGINVGNNNVYNVPITATNSPQDIEINFPLKSSVQVPLTMGITLSTSPVDLNKLTGLTWSISNVAVVNSNAPVGQLYNPISKDFSPVTGSIMTVLLNKVYNQQIPSYSVQPQWLNKVVQGHYTPQNDIIVVNGSPVQIAQPAISISSLPTMIPVTLQLVGSNPNYNAFTCSNCAQQPGLSYVNNYPVYGNFKGADVVSTILNTIPTTQSVALRLRVHVLGVWNNVGMNFRNNDKLVLNANINGANQPIDVEMHFPATASQPITFTFGLQDQKSPLQYAISDVAIVYSNAPVGQILNIQTGANSPVVGSFFTPLLNNVYTTGFPGYSAQPIWAQKVQLNVLSSPSDILSSNGNIMTLSSAPITSKAVNEGLNGLLSVQVQLVGPKADCSMYQSGSADQQCQMTLNGSPVYGMFSNGNVVTTTLNAPQSTQSVSYRFNLHLKGNWVNIPFSVTANDVNVLNVRLTGSNEVQNIELQFPVTQVQQPITLAFTIPQSVQSTQSPVQWALNNVAIAYSNAPVGQIYNLATGNFNKIPNSFFTTLLNSYHVNGFPQVKAQPSWVPYVANGIFSPLRDIISINGVPVQFGSSSPVASLNLVPVNMQNLQAPQITALNNFYPQNSMTLQLVGNNNFDKNTITCVYVDQSGATKNVDLSSSYLNGVQVLSGMDSNSECMTSFKTQPSTQAVAYRFTLQFVNTPVSSTPFTIQANKVPVFTSSLSPNNNVYQIELQFASAPSSDVKLTMNFGSPSAPVATPFKWTISEIATALSSAPVGTITNIATGENTPIQTSYFTAILNNLHLAQIPSYATQPSWLQLVINGNFASPSNLISIGGKLLNFGDNNINMPVGTQGQSAPSNKFLTILQLVGPNANLNNYACSTGCTMTTLNSIPVLGLFQPSNTVTSTIYPLASTQAVAYRITLHVVGPVNKEQQPFTVSANGVNVCSAPLSPMSGDNQNQHYNVECQFPTNNQQAIVLSFNFPSAPQATGEQQQPLTASPQFRWGLSNNAISYSTTPVGTIYVPATGEAKPIQGSYFTVLLNNQLAGQFPNVSQQPMWTMNVLNGLFTPKVDVISVNGKPYTIEMPVTLTNQLNKFLENAPLSFQLTGPKMDLSNWVLSSGKPAVYDVNGVSLVGPLSQSITLGTTINTLPNTQAVALRFNLQVLGSAVNAPFYCQANGNNVLSIDLSADNQMRQIESQFTASAGKPILMICGFSSNGKSETPFKWALGQVAIALSSTPAGTILNIANNSPVNVQNSYFTPLMNSYLAPTIQSLQVTPTWAPYVQAGQFSPKMDIIVVNGKPVDLNSNNYGPALVGLSGPSVGSTIALYNILNNLQTPASLANFNVKSSTILALVGNNFKYPNFSCNDCKEAPLSVQNVHGMPALGYLQPTSTLTAIFQTQPNTQSAALRFNLLVQGNLVNAPITITSNGEPILTTSLNCNNCVQPIELQFTAPSSKALNLAISFGKAPEHQQDPHKFQWAINELALSLSSTPAGTICNCHKDNAAPLSIQGSYFTPLLNIYTNNQIPGYVQQPSWLLTVINGQANNNNNIIAVNNVRISPESIALPSNIMVNYAPAMLQSSPTVLQLVGNNMNTAPWKLSTGPINIISIQGIPAIGQMTPSAVLSTQVPLQENTQAVALRFNLYVTGKADNAECVIMANGSPVMTFPLTANNEYRMVESQFAAPSSVQSMPLTMTCDTSSTSNAPFKWAVGDLAYTLSTTPVGTIFNTATGNNVPVTTSYFTPLLSIMKGSFPGYSTQPIWLSYVLNGQFSPKIDIISINNQLVKPETMELNPTHSALSVKIAPITLTSSFPSLVQLQSATLNIGSQIPVFAPKSLTYLSLVGNNFKFPEFRSSNSPLQVISVQGFPVLGGLTAPSTLETSIPTLPSTQSVATRFALYLIGQVNNVPFTVTANGVPVLNTILSGTNTFRNIELQFTVPSTTTSSSIPLVLSFDTKNVDPQQTQFKWGIGEFAVSTSPTPVGTILNSVTGGLNTVPSSYFAPLLSIYFNGQFPGTSQQPSWLSYVLNNQPTNNVDIIAVNGKPLEFPSNNIGILALQPNGNLNNYLASTSTPVYLVGKNFDLSQWTPVSSNPLQITIVGGIPTLGSFKPNDQVYTTLAPLPQTQSVALRFTLFMNGDWKNQPFNVQANGINVLNIPLTGKDQYRLIEAQFPVNPHTNQIVLSFGAPSSSNQSPIQWSIGQVAVAYSNAPVGQIISPVTGSQVPLLNSYFTPLLNSYLPGKFTGLSTQPIWLNYVRSGQFSPKIDIITVNGKPLNLEIASIPTTSALASFMTLIPTSKVNFTPQISSLALLQSSLTDPKNLIANFLTTNTPIIQLVGSNLDHTPFSGNVDFKIVYPLNSIPAIGNFPESGIVTQTLLPVEGTQTIALRFTVFTQGQLTTAPLTILANGQPVFSATLSPTTNQFNIEAQFPHTPSDYQSGVVLSISFAPVPTVVATKSVSSPTFKWSLGQVAIAYSPAPVGYIVDPVTNGHSPLLNSYFTPLLQSILQGTFPATKEQPIWLNQVLFGQLQPGKDFVSVNNVNLNLGSVPFSLAQSNSRAANFLTTTETVLHLVGNNVDLTPFTVSTGKLSIDYVKEIPVLSHMEPSTVLTTIAYPLASTQAVAVRFQLFISGPVSNVPFTVSANGVPALTAMLTGNNEIRLVEAQIPYTYNVAQPNVVLALTFNTASMPQSATPFKWTIGQLAIAYSNAPVGHVSSTAYDRHDPVQSSLFTPLLRVYYAGAFPGYTSQPIWTNHVLNGQFTKNVDIIAINSVLVNLPDASEIPQVQNALTITPSLDSVNILQTPSLAPQFNSQPNIILQLVGTNFDSTPYTTNNGNNLAPVTVNGIQILGTLSPKDVISTVLTPLPTTQSVALRFTLQYIGTPVAAPFKVLASGSPVLSIMLTGASPNQEVEVQFPIKVGTQQVPIDIKFDPTTQNFKWGIGQVAIAYSNTPVGTIQNSATGGQIPVTTSYFTPLLGIYLSGSFPNQSTQPSWLPVVQNGQFSPKVDIISINGKLVNFGTIAPTLQNNLLNNNFLTNTISVLELVAPKFDHANFASSTGPLSTTPINKIEMLGQLQPNSVLTYNLKPVQTTQSVALRFILAVTGPASNSPFTVSSNGYKCVEVVLNGNNVEYKIVPTDSNADSSESKTIQAPANFFKNVECQMPLSYSPTVSSVPITFQFAPSTDKQSTTPFQWSIGQLAITYSQAPVGQIPSSLTGSNIPLTGSYFTPLLSIHYKGAFPGYKTQPLWVPYVMSGQYNKPTDVVSINGININLSQIPTPYSLSFPTVQINQGTTPITNEFPTLNVIQSNNQLPTFTKQTLTVLELVGPTFKFDKFACDGCSTPIKQVYSNDVPSIGNFDPKSILSYQLVPLTSTKAGIVRFTLYVTGPVTNAPFTVSVGNTPVLTASLTGNSPTQNIEVQFPLTYSSSTPQVALTMNFGAPAHSQPIKWSIGQLAVHYSNVPAGQVYNTITGGSIPVAHSYLTAILQGPLSGSFPGYTTQPNWLNQVLAGEPTNQFDIIAINGTVLNLGTPAIRANYLQALIAKTAFLTQTKTVLELTGPKFTYPNFAVTQGTLGTTPVGSLNVLGLFQPQSVLSYTVQPMPQTQAGVVRFTLFVPSTVSNVPFTVSLGKDNLLTTPLSGTAFFRNIEVQFPLTSSSADSKLTFKFDSPAGSAPFQWGIGQLAISYSNAPVGSILSKFNGGYNTVPSSYFTIALQNFYGNAFPTYKTEQQPAWTPYVLNGQFNNELDLISIKGVILNLAPEVTIPQSSSAIPLNTAFSMIPTLQSNQFLPTVNKQSPTVLELTGANFPLTSFTSSTPVGIVYTNSIPALGHMTPSSTLSYPMTVECDTTKSATVRFQLHGLGSIQNVPFTINANNLNVMNVALSGNDLFRNVEAQFALICVEGQTGKQSIPLTISFASTPQSTTQAPFKWSISQFAVSYNSAPVGFHPNTVTGGYAPVTSSYYTATLPVFSGSSFPGYKGAQQPVWLPYVLNGQFNNAIDIITINGKPLNFDNNNVGPQSQVLQATNYAAPFNGQTQTVLELTGSNFPTTNFAISSGPLATTTIQSIQVLGQFPATSTLTYQLAPLPATKSAALRFMLLVNGNAPQNTPFCIRVNGVNVLTTGLKGTDFFHNVEAQFPLSLVNGAQQALTMDMNCDNNNVQSSSVPNFKWSIGQLAVTYSNAPLGFILNSYNGAFSPIANSYYTPLLNVFYGKSFPGYTASQQPIWTSYVKNGQPQNGIDIIALNNIVLNFGAPSTPLSYALTGLNIFTAPNKHESINAQFPTTLQLVGDKFDYPQFTSPTSFSLLHINSIPVLGYFNPSSVLSTTLEPKSDTKSVAVRFTLFLLGDSVKAPLTITYNGQPVLNAPINTNGYYQNVEAVFPHSSSDNKPVLSITFGSTNTPFQWAMSQFAVSYSTSPAGFILNTVTGQQAPLTTGYFTALLQNHLGGAFPTYKSDQQPIWLNYVLNGQCNNANDVIVVNNQVINCNVDSPFNVRNNQIKASFLTQSPTILELVGTNFKFPNFSINTGTLGTTTIQSIPALGQFAPGSILSYTLAPQVSTQAINLRFMMLVSGPADNVPLTLTANNVQIMTVPLTGNNFYRNIEIQFPYTNANNNNNVLTFQLGNTQSAPDLKWAVSQMAISYSNAPVGFILNSLNLGYSPVQKSFFTPALNNYYGSAFPNYKSEQQPIWLNYVINGQFKNTCDMVSLNGNLVNFAPYTVAQKSDMSTDMNCDLSSIKNLGNNLVASITPQISNVLELVGLNFKTNAFQCNNANCNMNYVNNAPVLGHFSPSTIVSYTLAPQPSTQAIVVRFNLHTIGSLSAVPLTMTLNGVNVLQYPITSTNSLHYVEASFPYATSSTNNYVLNINFAQPAENLNNFKWAIGQFATTYSNAPAGLVLNTVTGDYNAITNSFHTMTLPTYFNGAYPGYKSQPTWTAHVLNGQFVNNIDIIAINGKVLNFGPMTPSSVGTLQLHSIPQSQSSILNYQPYTQNVGSQLQYGGVTQNTNGLFNFSPLMIDLVGAPLSNKNEWTVNTGDMNTINLNGVNFLGQFGPNVVLTRQYLNLGNSKSLGVIFNLNVASPTGFNFRVQANGINIVQQPLQAGTYSKIMEAHFEIPKQNVVLTFSANTDSGVSPQNAGGWSIGSVGFLSNPCDVKNFYNVALNRCQYAGNSVFHALTFVNYKQGFAQLTAQPTWYLNFATNNVGAPNQMYYINNVNVPYKTGTESNLVAPTSIHQTQYSLLGGNHIQIHLTGTRFNLPTWSVNTGDIKTSTLGDIKVLGTFNIGQVLSANFQTPVEHATIVLRFRLHGVGSWNNLNFYTTLGAAKILTRDITLNNDFRDIELQFTHNAPTLNLIFGINAGNNKVDSNTGYAISNLVLHMNPCAIKNTYNVLQNTCVESGNTALYSLYRTDYFGQFFKDAGLNLIYLTKFQPLTALKDDGKEIYGSWTGDSSNLFTGKVLIELSGPNFDFKDWQVKGKTRQAPYTSQLYGSTAFGPYESATVLRRVFTNLPAHTTLVGRIRIYLVGNWIDQNTVLQANGVNIFHYVLGTNNNYQDLEFSFDHTGPTLDFSIQSTADSAVGAREGIKFGISDMALYVSPCAQKSFFNIGLGSCALNTGHSTFYNLVQINLNGFFPLQATRPVWINLMSSVNGIDSLAREVYSFLAGTKLEVIMGVNGKPQFADIDLLARLKTQIDSKPTASNSVKDLSFLSGRSSKKIIGDYTNGTISSYGNKFEALVGNSVALSKVNEFKFAFGVLTGSACVGLIETRDITTLDLESNLRDKSLVVCSDELTQASTKFLVKIDDETKTISFVDQFYKQNKELKFVNAANLYFTVQFENQGTVYFGKSADMFQPKQAAAEESETSN